MTDKTENELIAVTGTVIEIIYTNEDNGYTVCEITSKAEGAFVATGYMPYVNEDFATESLAVDADIVIIMLGTNDSKPMNWNAEQYETEYAEFVQTYQNMESSPEVYIMLPPRVFLEDTDNGNCNNATLTKEVIPAIKRVAEKTGANLIDLYTVTEAHPEWFADGLHPNAAGNQAIAQAICDILNEN